jgi:Ca2+/Na+ antiporter
MRELLILGGAVVVVCIVWSVICWWVTRQMERGEL